MGTPSLRCPPSQPTHLFGSSLSPAGFRYRCRPWTRNFFRFLTEPHQNWIYHCTRFPSSYHGYGFAYAESYSFSRLATLLHLRKLGIHLTSRKEEAIMCGDISGDVLHPFFVHFSNAVGMHLHASVEDSPAMLRLHARHAQRALERMSEAGKSDNAELKAQMLLWATSACTFQRWFRQARAYRSEEHTSELQSP